MYTFMYMYIYIYIYIHTHEQVRRGALLAARLPGGAGAPVPLGQGPGADAKEELTTII